MFSTEETGAVKYDIHFNKYAENTDIIKIINNINSSNNNLSEKAYIGVVNEKTANLLKSLIGFDTSGYNVVIEARQIKHIIKEHGKNGSTDNSMANENLIAKIPFVLKNYDSIVESGQTKAYVSNINGENKPAKTVLYEKKLVKNHFM